MAKQKPSPFKREKFEVMMEVIFEGDKCMGVRIINPSISWMRMGSMGIKIQRLADTIFQRKNIQKDVDKIDDEIRQHIYGQTS